jgi:hypothetical protein
VFRDGLWPRVGGWRGPYDVYVPCDVRAACGRGIDLTTVSVRQPVVRGDQVTIGTTMTLTLTIDHRAVDGAAVFLTRLRELIEKPWTSCYKAPRNIFTVNFVKTISLGYRRRCPMTITYEGATEQTRQIVHHHAVLRRGVERRAGRLQPSADATTAASIAEWIATLFAGHVAKENDLLLPTLADSGADLAALLVDMHQLHAGAQA